MEKEWSPEKRYYLNLLAEKYPSMQNVWTEIINLQAIMNLPKGTEHFMSDLHGEYEAFTQILNNCSGVIIEKVNMLFENTLSSFERNELCTLIYYPEQKLSQLHESGKISDGWYQTKLQELTDLAKLLSSKYTRSKVRKAMPQSYSYIIDELLHAQPDEDNNQLLYHQKIIDTLIRVGSGDSFICALSDLIKRLAVDLLHIVGDVFDRGPRPDSILDMLSKYHNVDIEWGNHDILWMGAAAGNKACIATVVRNSLSYGNTQVLESGYGISLRPLYLFADHTYPGDINSAARKAISVILFKLEGNIIMNHPEYCMDEQLLLHKMNLNSGTIEIDGKIYELNDTFFPTLDFENPYELTEEEKEIIEDLKQSFTESERLNRHIEFLYKKGSMYRCCNGNLLYHGCIPLDSDGNFDSIELEGGRYWGKSYMDYADRAARRAFLQKDDENAVDFMWYLWCGEKSPLSGRRIKTFQRMFLNDKTAWEEPRNPYYEFYKEEAVCKMILRKFGLFGENCHIINGHTPIKVSKGESPIKANGRLIVIDGGFCKAYQKTTGIAGYTLIFNSHGLRLMSHQPFSSIEKVLNDNEDIESQSEIFETEKKRVMVGDTDTGVIIKEKIAQLEQILELYRQGKRFPL